MAILRFLNYSFFVCLLVCASPLPAVADVNLLYIQEQADSFLYFVPGGRDWEVKTGSLDPVVLTTYVEHTYQTIEQPQSASATHIAQPTIRWPGLHRVLRQWLIGS